MLYLAIEYLAIEIVSLILFLSGADMISGADIHDIISSLIFISEILIFCKIVVKTLKWPKIPEDSSDFDDF